MEFGLHEELAIYAGGLGILAGDYMKSAGELGMPVVGIGLLWSEGYTRQRIGDDGMPYDEFPRADHSPVKDTGRSFRISIAGKEIECGIFVVDCYGNAPLYLLQPKDANERWMTRRLYSADKWERIAQEILLGAGGVRALRALEVPVDLYHFNEGHAVFAGVELLGELVAGGTSWDEARRKVRDHIVLTTHTPVDAGNEKHPFELLEKAGALGRLNGEQMRDLGGDPFNMTLAGLRLAGVANAVSALHADTARTMWRGHAGAASICHITNGVHRTTWQDGRIRLARDPNELSAVRAQLKTELLGEIRRRTGAILDPHRLTIGFARRAALYKRADLIFRDPGRSGALLRDRIQIVFSGKAHPQDTGGKELIARIVKAAKANPGSVVFLEDYEMGLAKLLTRGCDVWLNNPRRPQEASGTSGMKAALNGALNVSVVDGWWPEGCVHGVNGWQVGSGYTGDDLDDHDAAALYQTLEGDVIPTFYERRGRWLAMARASIEMAERQFTSHRMVEEYFAKIYEPLDRGRREGGQR
jgi:glycogen phosphorylase